MPFRFVASGSLRFFLLQVFWLPFSICVVCVFCVFAACRPVSLGPLVPLVPTRFPLPFMFIVLFMYFPNGACFVFFLSSLSVSLPSLVELV